MLNFIFMIAAKIFLLREELLIFLVNYFVLVICYFYSCSFQIFIPISPVNTLVFFINLLKAES